MLDIATLEESEHENQMNMSYTETEAQNKQCQWGWPKTEPSFLKMKDQQNNTTDSMATLIQTSFILR